MTAKPPHPPLPAYYGAADARPAFVEDLFDRTAPHYERINRWLSFGSGAWYRKKALARLGVGPGARGLDVGTGTGLVLAPARAAAGADGVVVGLDPSTGMLREAGRRHGAPLVRAVGERTPFADGAFDYVTIGYALRHVADLHQAFAEWRRVVRPGGAVFAIEITRPRSRAGYAAAKLFLGRIVPAVSGLLTRDREARRLMDYYWDTIDRCVPPPEILAAMRAAGLDEPVWRRELGLFSEFTGRVP